MGRLSSDPTRGTLHAPGSRLARALEVYRYERGAYPQHLDRLVEVGIVRAEDIRFPFDRPYFYRLSGERFVLLPPIH